MKSELVTMTMVYICSNENSDTTNLSQLAKLFDKYSLASIRIFSGNGLFRTNLEELSLSKYVLIIKGPQSGFAPSVERPTVRCQGKLCKAGKCGLAKSSSSFQVLSPSHHNPPILFYLRHF